MKYLLLVLVALFVVACNNTTPETACSKAQVKYDEVKKVYDMSVVAMNSACAIIAPETRDAAQMKLNVDQACKKAKEFAGYMSVAFNGAKAMLDLACPIK